MDTNKSECPADTITPKKILSMDGLRFIAVSCIVFNHGTLFFPSWKQMNCPFYLSQAVSLFIIMSGFLLSLSAKELTDFKSIKRFYMARIARIWPTHIFCLLFLLIMMPAVFRVSRTDVLPFLSNVLLIHSWVPVSNYNYSFNAPSWSLSTLFFLYLCFPILYKLASRNWLVCIMASASITLSVIWCAGLHPLPEVSSAGVSLRALLYVSPLSRFLEFATGIVFACAFRRFAHQIQPGVLAATFLEVSLLAVILLMSMESVSFRYSTQGILTDSAAFYLQNSGLTLIPFALFIFVIAMEKGLLALALRQSPLVRLGSLSMAIFLIHAPLMLFESIDGAPCSTWIDNVRYVTVLLLSAFLVDRIIAGPAQNFSARSVVLNTRAMIEKFPPTHTVQQDRRPE